MHFSFGIFINILVVAYAASLMSKRKGHRLITWTILSFVFPPALLVLWSLSVKSDFPKLLCTRKERSIEVIGIVLAILDTVLGIGVTILLLYAKSGGNL